MANKKNYTSLGQMLKKGDFESLLEDLQEIQKNDNLKELTYKNSEVPFSQLDQLLFFFPTYCIKNIKTEDGKTILGTELLPKAKEFLEFILSLGADPNVYMTNGENAFLKSCELQNTEILDYLIHNPYTKANYKHADGRCNNGLFYATMAEATNALEYLVKECHLNINEKNFFSDNQTVLFYACGHMKESSFYKLIDLGADLTLEDSYGNKAVDMILPGYDADTIEENFDLNDEDDKLELQKWKDFYTEVKEMTENFEQQKKTQLKVKF
jgi:hypothetical protein